MSFIKKVLVIDFNKEFSTNIKATITELSNKHSVDLVHDKNTFSEKNTGINYDFVFLNANIGPKDSLYLLRYFAIQQKSYPISVHLMSEDINVLKDILENTPFPEIQVITTPSSPKEIVKTMLDLPSKEHGDLPIEGTKSKKGTIDTDFINVFIVATKDVIAQMGQLDDLKHKKPFLHKKSSGPLQVKIASRIMISSQFFKGSFYVIFEESTFLNLYEQAVFEKHHEINKENQDFASELANIIYGQSKKVLSENGVNLEMAIPTIHLEKKIESSILIMVEFESTLGNFFIAVAPDDF